ncbi:DUF6082 family protein [Actinomadura sp. K4S16]|uniref:DUF6082 family protein n=1 Tax=Actinomadura sp. K4S16 TaxID=1316147 RepID=UPI001F3C79B0|nr:DUF6082 family protein [Actinomadura sp. K4S16]
MTKISSRQILAWTLAFSILFILVFLSPLALLALSGTFNANWTRISEIGQAYGGISALVSAIALCGLVVSLLLQIRSYRDNRKTVQRSGHLELIRMAMENPRAILPVWGYSGIRVRDRTDEQWRQFLFITSNFKHCQQGFLSGEFSERVIRDELCQSAFQTEIGREWWQVARSTWEADAMRDEKRRQMFEIIDSEYREAMEMPPLVASDAARMDRVKRVAFGATMLAAGLALGAFFGKRNSGY